MSRVNEILEDLFAEMIKEGHEEIGMVKEFLGIKFDMNTVIRLDAEAYDREVIKEYQEANCTPVAMPGEKRGIESRTKKVEAEETKMITYYISRDDINGLLIHELIPDFMENERWISGGYSYSLKNEKSYIERLDYLVSDMTEWNMFHDTFLKEIKQDTKNIMF